MLYQLSYSRGKVWGEVDSNHCRQCRRVYSPLPLATRASPQKTTLKELADDGTRTRNRLITNQVLYQLSYASPTDPKTRAAHD